MEFQNSEVSHLKFGFTGHSGYVEILYTIKFTKTKMFLSLNVNLIIKKYSEVILEPSHPYFSLVILYFPKPLSLFV